MRVGARGGKQTAGRPLLSALRLAREALGDFCDSPRKTLDGMHLGNSATLHDEGVPLLATLRPIGCSHAPLTRTSMKHTQQRSRAVWGRGSTIRGYSLTAPPSLSVLMHAASRARAVCASQKGEGAAHGSAGGKLDQRWRLPSRRCLCCCSARLLALSKAKPTVHNRWTKNLTLSVEIGGRQCRS